MTKSVNKVLILLVALLVCATVVFAACSKDNFKAVQLPQSGTVDSNGGIAVVYGEWLYYVNGYTSNVSADNTYSDDVKTTPRIGSVVRIKLAEIEGLFEINDDKDLSSSEKSEKIAETVRAKAETVVPKIYYSGNTTTTQFTGIYIYDNRIYVTTPNDELTANGDPLTDQLVLMSFDLGGGNRQSHYTFTSNSAQIWLTKDASNKLVAVYLMDNILHTLDVASGVDTVVKAKDSATTNIANTVSGVTWDKSSNSVFFIDEFYALCKLTVGESSYEVICENDTAVNHGDHVEAGSLTYTIKSANKGIVYYTKSDTNENTASGNTILYWADTASKDNVALATNEVSVYGWDKDKLVMVDSYVGELQTYYSICIVDGATNEKTAILAYGDNNSSITINRIEGDILYYTSDTVAYTIDLSTVQAGSHVTGTPYAKSLASATGWAAPDLVTHNGNQYVITISADSVSIVKFNPEDKKNSNSVALTLTAESEEE
ncbi:MAG: hypothetical protein J1G02_05240 [Clostridiales bacterium]|nr:hypothetical protein [Clostridiales bacterium]